MRRLFDSHFHIIDPAFPLVPNQGFLPDPYSIDMYRAETAALGLDVAGGVIVSGSFQAHDTAYLAPALSALGPSWRAVMNLAADLDDKALRGLHGIGVRAMRINLRRGDPAQLKILTEVAHRIWDLSGWHVEFYIDAATLPDLLPTLGALPKVAIDHVGLSEAGLPYLLDIVGRGARVKATGFSRFDGDVGRALRKIHDENPQALMVGTDLPSTRAPSRFGVADLDILDRVFSAAERLAITVENAKSLYQVDLD